MKKYTLQEAFDKRLLMDGDTVDILLLYLPLKHLLTTEKLLNFDVISLARAFENVDFIDGSVHSAFGYIKRTTDERIYVSVSWRIAYFGYNSSQVLEMVEKQLLTDMDYNIIAESDGKGGYKIYMGPDITVRFDDKDYAILELPNHNVYIPN